MNSFPKAHRLLNADDYSSVFIFRKVKSGQYVKIHFKPNELGYSRLGLVVSKKISKRANKRNYMKRFLREYFRQNQYNWVGLDIIVRVQKLYTKNEYKDLVLEMNNLTSKWFK